MRRAQRPGGRRSPRNVWLQLAAAAFLVAVTALTVGCGDDDAASALSDDPPWGLTGIEMPDTEAEVVAVLQAAPAVDGHQPVFSLEEEFGHPAVIYYEIEGFGVRVTIGAVPVSGDPLDLLDPEEAEAGGFTVEATALDPDGDLLWIAGSDEVVFGCMWADPDGSWVFAVQADSPESRTKLVHAFITAAGG